MTYIQAANRTHYIFIVKIKYAEVTNSDLCIKHFLFFFLLSFFVSMYSMQSKDYCVIHLAVCELLALIFFDS